MSYSRVTVKDRTSLSVYDTLHGDRTILFLHGNSCDHTFLAPQIEYFSPRFRVVAPDLRGHGASDKPDCAYTFARLSDDLAEMAEERGLPPMNVVGHSMGGMVALELSHRYPALVLTLACLDSTVLTPPGRPSRIHSLLEGLKSEAWQSYFRRYFEAAFEPTDDPARKQAILQRMLATPQHVVVSLFEQWRVADGAAAAQACRAPFLYVSSSKPRTDTAQLRELCPQLATGQVVGSGHFMTLEVPDQVNAMIERFLAINDL